MVLLPAWPTPLTPAPCLPFSLTTQPAEQVDEASVWSELAHAYLDHAQVGEAIAAYLRAADTTKYNEVIAKANEVRLCGGRWIGWRWGGAGYVVRKDSSSLATKMHTSRGLC